MSELYLESVIRDKLGVSDGLIKKTRREVVASMDPKAVVPVIIKGRTHTAYGLEVVEKVVSAISGKKTRASGSVGVSSNSFDEILSAAVVQGVPAEIEGTEKVRSDEVTLKVRLITKNRVTLLAHHPEGDHLDPVRLRVKDTTLFIHGMDIPGCRKVGAFDYQFAGRQPRSRGRW